MLSLSVFTLTSILIALANPAATAPIAAQPALTKRLIGAHLALAPGVCIGVDELKDGAKLSKKDCATHNAASNPPFYNKWDIVPGNNQVVMLSGLPSGVGPSASIRTSLDNRSPTPRSGLATPGCLNSKHLAVTGGTTCLDVDQYGVGFNTCNKWAPAQSYDLVDNGDFIIIPPPVDPPTTTVPTVDPPTATPPSVSQGKPIKWTMDGQQKCLTVASGTLANGVPLQINDCFGPSSDFYALQQFVYSRDSTKIRVAPNSISTTDFCVDFGSDRGVNGVGLKIWQCYDNLPAQQLWITGDNHIAVEGDNQCADVRSESQATGGKPYGSLKEVQSWQCTGDNTNQIFGF